jgi:sugar phosphate isomerase/epimerase
MKLGISSYTYGWAVGVDGNRPTRAPGARELIDRAIAAGVSLLQICDNLPPETYEEASVAAIARYAREQGVELEVGTRGSDPAHLRRLIGIATALRSRFLRVVTDTFDDHPTPDDIVARLRDVLPDLGRAGVTLGIENHDRLRSAALARIVRDVASPSVGICLDTVNSFGALEGPEVVVDTLGPHVVNLHLKDFAVVRLPHLQGFTVEGRPAGQGMLDIPWLLAKLKAFGRDPNAILELWTPPEPDVGDTIRKEAAWAGQSVRAARRWIGS